MKSEKGRDDLPVYLFHQGTNFRSHLFLGCHYQKNSEYAVFRTWAPHAKEISVVGDWNDWKEDVHPMHRISDQGVWEIGIEGIQLWQRYKFSILGSDHMRRLKSDPFAFHAETDGKTASIVYDLSDFPWQDEDWMAGRMHRTLYDKPMNIYELHIGSWRKHLDGRNLSYGELVEQLVPYLCNMGYTHLELLPVMEHPFGRSWGYQISNYFAVTSRFGTPHDFMTLIDACHRAGIGVILDWVPSHFPKDSHGLVEFDGAPLYEAQGSHRMEQREWGTRHFDYGSTEVQSFLISNALFWLDVYHADGLRVDAVSSMLDLAYGKNPGEWDPNSYGGRENLDAIAFLRKLNKAVHENCPGTMMIAEEATAWPLVTAPEQEGGLEFDFKWNMGWMNDMMDYVGVDPFYRKLVHDKITFSLLYAFSEHFILPISHDEVVYGKRSLLDKMPGEYAWKFAGARAFLGYMMAHPGKKLNFMGNEIGQFKEWDFDASVEWFLLDYPAHHQFQQYVRDLNHFYLTNPPLWEIDDGWKGFRWIVADDSVQNIAVFLRMDKTNGTLVVLQNFAPTVRREYRFGVPEQGSYEEVFNSDATQYGGWGHENGPVSTENKQAHGFSNSLTVTVPPLSTVFFRFRSEKGRAPVAKEFLHSHCYSVEKNNDPSEGGKVL